MAELLTGTNLPNVTTKGDLIVGTSAGTAARLAIGANGTIPVADSNATSNITYALPWIQKWQTNMWYSASSGSSTSAGLGDGSLRVVPIYVPNYCTLKKIAAEVTAAGGANSVIRLGIWNDDGTGFPGSLLLDAGTIDGTSNTIQSITISQALGPGLYWIGACLQGTPVGDPTVRTVAGTTNSWGQLGNGNTTAGTATTILGYLKTGTSGAFVNWAGATTAVHGTAARVMVQVT